MIVAQETSWSGFRIDLDILCRAIESNSTTNTKKDSSLKPPTKDEKSTSSDRNGAFAANLYHSGNDSKILIHRRPYPQLKAARDRIRKRPVSQAPNSLNMWKRSDRRPAPLVVRSVKVDRELYGQQMSYTTESMVAEIGASYGPHKRLSSCSGTVFSDRAVMVCVFEEAEAKSECTVSCGCVTIFDSSKHEVTTLDIDDEGITTSEARLLRPKCINSSRVMLLHQSAGIKLYEKESSADNCWRLETSISHCDFDVDMVSMMQTAGGICIATAKQSVSLSPYTFYRSTALLISLWLILSHGFLCVLV